ncbi:MULTISPECIES: CRISPR-associated helicase/endonuclease Cas3 [Thermoanaerobacter]|uniref:CRISPR-associated HD domain protein n=1 Tax=Thermoanaerobacter wiegelii Rt8.B1 TaxID=697303 RepID=G2MUB9_9THEO|nr:MULTISPECIES: CRISPR-associated helicase/endonuclease Cas3 [Thermoanaerobacter]ABY93583.1 CRISPR-associated helicase Cas3 [Thermoanaerobacter sp. X514]AEM79946.1 CRISPR-associated HD domain protein [Thermoanaerobacter wiegelii Rt8.B1]
MKYYSHYDEEMKYEKLLYEHLIEVKNLSINQIPEEYKKAYEIIALCHDFGKYTSYFQEYLKTKKKTSLSNHSFISAVFGGYVAIQYYGEENILPLIVYNTILHHHGNLESFSVNLPSKFKDVSRKDFPLNVSEKIDISYKQLKDMRQNLSFIIPDFERLGLAKEFKQFVEEENVIKDTLAILKKLEALSIRRLKSDENYFIHQMLYSALISADKISASNTYLPEELYVDYKTLNKIRENQFEISEKDIDKIRTEIFKVVIENLEKNYNKSKIFSITAPTGTGKTVTGFFAALKLKELLGGNRKIIYSLPFTSIIEQNYGVLFELLEKLDKFKGNSSRYIIKHHNLAMIEYESEYRDYKKTEAELLIENWQSGIIITTFVQLLETLVGARNRMLKKFNALKGSIIILDEIQAINIKYFQLVDYILNKASEYLDLRIIIMTATKPMILNDAVELLDNNEKYFSIFKRTRLMPQMEKLTIESFIEKFKENLEDKSYLIVCNTIMQSLEIYKRLVELGLNREIFYLSTNILPLHRRERINKIKEKLEKEEKIILVSTQVVEAGVDFDFDVVIRDLGPIDSIIQSAGRCNRNGKKEIGDVYVYKMIDEEENLFGKYVYGNTLMNISENILKRYDTIMEEKYFQLINEYFSMVMQNKSSQVSREFIKSIENLDFSEGEYAIDSFSLIENNPGYFEAFFIYDDVAEDIFKKYLKLSNIKDFNARREAYLEIQKNIKDYILSLPKKYINNFQLDKGIPYLPKEGIKDIYDFKTGFKRDIDDKYMIF